MLKISWTRAAAWRARRHYLHERAPAAKMLGVASRLCGLHAQVMSSAELSLWARVENLERGAVQGALWNERTLVKTWAMRGTLHLLPTTELPLWHAALRTSRRYRTPAYWKRALGITLDELDSLTEAVGTVLADRVMTREELAQEVGKHMGAAALAAKLAEGAWSTVLKPAAFSGRLCFAPSTGQRVRFTHPDTWTASGAPRSRAANTTIDERHAQTEIARRYLAAYAPATSHDLGRWWGGAGVAEAKRWIASLGEEVTQVDLDGAPAWMLAAHTRELRELAPARSVRLLPAFDQYIIGASRHAEHLLPGNLRSRVYRPQGWVSPVVLVNGLMQGIWRHEVKGSRVEVVIEPFVKLPGWVRREAGEEAERLAAFLGCALSFSS
jgi:hypothetical protein